MFFFSNDVSVMRFYAVWNFPLLPCGPVHNVAFQQGLHCSLRQIDLQRKKCIIVLEIISSNPSVHKMDHPDFIARSFMENFISLKKVKRKKSLAW